MAAGGDAAEPQAELPPAKRAKAAKKVKEPVAEQGVSAGDRSAMIGWMKFQQEAQKTTAAQKEHAKSGLAYYENLDKKGKAAFVTRWKATKDKKNADWVKDFEEEMNRTREFTREKKTGLMTRPV